LRTENIPKIDIFCVLGEKWLLVCLLYVMFYILFGGIWHFCGVCMVKKSFDGVGAGGLSGVWVCFGVLGCFWAFLFVQFCRIFWFLGAVLGV